MLFIRYRFRAAGPSGNDGDDLFTLAHEVQSKPGKTLKMTENVIASPKRPTVVVGQPDNRETLDDIPESTYRAVTVAQGPVSESHSERGSTMKRWLAALMIVIVLVFACDMAFAKPKDKGQGKPAGRPEGSAAKAAKEAGGKEKGKGQETGQKTEDESVKGQEKVIEAITRRMEKEEAKHRERVARIERIRDLHRAKDNDKAVEQVEKLIEKENERHERVMKKLAEQSEKALERFNMKMERVRERDTNTRKEQKKDDDEDDEGEKGKSKERGSSGGKKKGGKGKDK